MIIVDRDAALDALYDLGLDDDALREDYSGRFMYGDTCMGIVCDTGQAFSFIARLALDSDDVLDWVEKARSDNMGLEAIWYWPGVQISS